MPFSMSPFPLQFGSRGGGDPTALTAALLTALGFATTRTGTALSQKKGTQPSYELVAANKPTFRRSLIDGVAYSALYVYGSAVPLVSYSNDLTNAAWVKNGCTAELALGGLVHDVAWRGASYTGLGWEASDFAGSVGAVDGDTLSNTSISSSESYPRFGNNIAAAAGKFILASGRIDGDRSSVVLIRYISGGTTISGTYDSGTGEFTLPILLVEGAIPRLFIYTNGTTLFEITVAYLSIREVDAHSLATFDANNGTVTRTLTRTSANRASLFRIEAPATNAGAIKASQDNGSTQVTVTPGSFQEIELPAVTSANPTLHIQGTILGDTAKVYDVQHFEPAAGVPVPRHVPPQGATPASLGANSILRTLASSPATVDLSFLAVTPPVNVSASFVLFTLYESATVNDRLQVYFANGSYFLRKNASTDVEIAGSISRGDVVRIDVQWDGSNIRARADGGSWASLTHETIHAFDRFALGHDNVPALHWCSSEIAVRDNAGTILGAAGAGFNLKALA